MWADLRDDGDAPAHTVLADHPRDCTMFSQATQLSHVDMGKEGMMEAWHAACLMSSLTGVG